MGLELEPNGRALTGFPLLPRFGVIVVTLMAVLLVGCGRVTEAAHVGTGGHSLICFPGRGGIPCARAAFGRLYPYSLRTHCGVRDAYFAGRLWLADPPLDDGSGNPPPGWGNPFQQGMMRLIAGDRAQFRVGARLDVRFKPAPPHYRSERCE